MRKVAVILVCLVLVVSGMCALADAGAGGKTRPVEEFRELLSGGTGDDPVILDKGDSAPAAIVLHGSGYVAKGHKIKLKATVTPESPEQEIVWRSSDEEIATVSQKGVVTGIKGGKVTITAKLKSNSKVRKKMTVTVMEKAASKVVIDQMPDALKIGCKCELKASVKPAKAARTVTWSSSDKKIATVNSKGVVKGLKTGKVTITATATDGTKVSASVEINVVENKPRYRALVVANGDYAGVLNDLPGAGNNVKTVSGFLTKSVEEEYKVTHQKGCTAKDIVSLISSTFRGATNDDVSLFYYNGHGASDGKLLCINDSCLPLDKLSHALQAVPGKVIVILDSCYAGIAIIDGDQADRGDYASFNGAVIDAFSGFSYRKEVASRYGEFMIEDKFIVLTACGDEKSYASPKYAVFTKAMMDVMGCKWRSGAITRKASCDANKDGVVTLGECISGIRARLPAIFSSHGCKEALQDCMSYGDLEYQLFRLKQKAQ